jgi:hypothetical protein
MPIPDLFQSPATQNDLTKFGPTHWNNVTELLESLLGDPADADGTVLVRDSASDTGASWQTAPVPAGVVLESGSYADPSWITSLSAAKLSGSLDDHLWFATDNTYNIGASGARPANYLGGGHITTSSTSPNTRIGFSLRALLTAPSDGVLMLTNAAVTDFSRLQFGGTTSSFPALKRSSTALQVRLADDSSDAAITALSFTEPGNSTCGFVATARNGAMSNPAAGKVRFYVREDGADAVFVARLADGTETTVATLVTGGNVP